MNRRSFLRTLGTGAAVAAPAVVAPSMVWPFRKYFLPAMKGLRFDMLSLGHWGQLFARPGDHVEIAGIAADPVLNGYYAIDDAGTEWLNISRTPYPGKLTESAVQAVELESFAKQIPNLLRAENAFYEALKKIPDFGIRGRENPAGITYVDPLSGTIFLKNGSKLRYEATDPNDPEQLKAAETANAVFFRDTDPDQGEIELTDTPRKAGEKITRSVVGQFHDFVKGLKISDEDLGG